MEPEGENTQITLFESFYATRPTLDPEPARYIQITAASGQSTDMTDPPKVWINYPVTEYTALADASLEQYQERLQTHLPAVERPFLIFSEADVVRAAALYMLHPINEALNACSPRQIFCRSESKQQGGGRCDVLWQYFDEQEGAWVVIAVLELKNRGMLHWNDLRNALRDTSTYAEGVNKAVDAEDFTLFGDNMVKISKQAAAYAWQTGTPFVAVLDWDSLFMFQFNDVDDEQQSVGDWTWGTWVVEEDSITFRKALLGFLLQACANR